MNLHGKIMNLPVKPYDCSTTYDAYCRGHRDARHAAADLANAADAEIERLRDDRDCEKRLRKDAEDRREELSEEIDRLDLENDRLRWSLRQIAGAGIDWCQEKQQIARDALDHIPGAALTVGAVLRCLVGAGLIPSEAVDDPEGYDGGLTETRAGYLLAALHQEMDHVPDAGKKVGA